MLKKINAVLTCICILLLLDHMVFMSLVLWGIVPTENANPGPGRALMICMLLHGIFSVVSLIRTGARGGKGYPKLNKQTIEQRFTGILLVILAVLHFIGNRSGAKLFVISEIALVPVVTAHVMASFHRAMITLGISSPVAERIFRPIMVLAFLGALSGVIAGWLL